MVSTAVFTVLNANNISLRVMPVRSIKNRWNIFQKAVGFGGVVVKEKKLILLIVGYQILFMLLLERINQEGVQRLFTVLLDLQHIRTQEKDALVVPDGFEEDVPV